MINKEVFISYKSEDFAQAEWVRSTFENNGIESWMLSFSVLGSSTYADDKPQAIKNCKFFVVLFSKNSQDSAQVLGELEQAVKYGKKILPFMLEECSFSNEVSDYLKNVTCYKGYEDKTAAIEKMISVIKADLSIDSKEKSSAENKEKSSYQSSSNEYRRMPSRALDIPDILKENEVPKKKSKKKIVYGILAGVFALFVFVSVLTSSLNKVEIAGQTYKKDDNSIYLRDYEVTVEDIEAIGKMEAVTFVQFTNCTFPDSDLSWIPNTVNSIKLENCNLTNEHIKSIDFASSDLSSINFDSNKNITDLSKLGVLGEELTSLSFSDCSVSDISFLSEFDNLHSLYFDSNNVSDISALSNCKELQIVSFNSNKVKDVKALSNCVELREIYVNSNMIATFDGLEKAIMLKKIEADTNKIVDTDGLNNTTILEYVSLKSNGELTDISFLSDNSASMKELYIDGNNIADYSPISELIYLKKLTMDNCKNVKSFDFIKNCTKMTYLSASNSGIESFSGLENLNKLFHIDVSDNNLSSLDHLPEFKDSVNLSLRNNKFTEIIMPECRIRNLDILGNPISKIDLSRISGISVAMEYYDGYDYASLCNEFTTVYVIDCPTDKKSDIQAASDKIKLMTEEEYIETEK